MSKKRNIGDGDYLTAALASLLPATRLDEVKASVKEGATPREMARAILAAVSSVPRPSYGVWDLIERLGYLL